MNREAAQPLTESLKDQARRLGFSLTGACPAVTPTGITQLASWLEAGYAGEMHYLADRRDAYSHPSHVLDGARSILMLAMNYRTVEPRSAGPGEGRISRYAWGTDYHDVIRERLHRLADFLRAQRPDAHARAVIDTAPLLEREFAQHAGLGWIGKNTLLLNREAGSWFFLAALITDIELDYDDAHATDHCGTCTACLDACPTDAFVEPYVLDSRKCISYLTIELKEAIPEPLREGLGDWLFGCDVCQDVCPWNGRAPKANEPAFQPIDDSNPVALTDLFGLTDDQFRKRFRPTPLWRPKRRGLLRNAAIVLGNRPRVDSISALTLGLNDDEPLVRGASAWSLGRQNASAADDALRERLAIEPDATVQDEIRLALASRD